MTIGNNTPMYPCNRGDKYNTLNRGWHHFETNAYGTCCIYCGEPGPEREVEVTYSNNFKYGSRGICPVCGQNHTQTAEEAHPSYNFEGPPF